MRAFLRRSRASLLNSVGRLAKFIMVFVLKSDNSGASVQLGSKNFVGLDEAVKFGCEVVVLGLKYLSVAF